jgi:hypothetical protein
MTPFTVLAALALSTFAPTPPARTASEPGTPKADATTAKPTTPAPGTPGGSPSRQYTAPERAPAGMENYALLARCQMACDESNTTANKERASCKITCLKTYPATPRKYEFVPGSRTTPTNPKRDVVTPEASPPTTTTPPGAAPTNPKRQVTTPETSPGAPATNPKRQTPPS